MPEILPVGFILHKKYRIVRMLGKGGFAITYLAEHNTLRTKVAIKELFLALPPTIFCTRVGNSVQPNGEIQKFAYFRQRFLEEAQMTARFQGVRGIVQVNDIFEENNTVYAVMDYVEGDTLDKIVAQAGGKLPETTAIQYANQLLTALTKVHDAGVLHRDIKPQNIIVDARGLLTLIDFGISRDYEEDSTLTQSVMLTRGYSPPEQGVAQAKRGAYTDLYAVGGTLYFLLTGKPPQTTDERSFQGFKSVKHYTPTATPALDALVTKAIQSRPTDRFQSCAEMLAALGQCGKVEVVRERVVAKKEEKMVGKEDKDSGRFAMIALFGLGFVVFGILVNYMVKEQKEQAKAAKELAKAERYSDSLALARASTFISFERNKASIGQGSLPKLDTLIEVMKKNPDCRVKLTIYNGKRETNNDLSERKVKEVTTYLVRKGIDEKRISKKILEYVDDLLSYFMFLGLANPQDVNTTNTPH
jgi:serine/threonine protein kinase